MSHGVHAVQHEVEHKIKHDEHGGGHDLEAIRNRNVALLIAVMALFLAFSETLGKSAQTSALNYQIEASNLWNFFQAKNIRRTSTIVATEQAKIDADRRQPAPEQQGGDGEADRRLDEDRGALSLGTRSRRWQGRRHRRTARGARSRSRKSATSRSRDIITMKWRRRRSRSASCWLGDRHHRHDRADLSRDRAGAGRHRLHGDRAVRAPRRAFVLSEVLTPAARGAHPAGGCATNRRNARVRRVAAQTAACAGGCAALIGSTSSCAHASHTRT